MWDNRCMGKRRGKISEDEAERRRLQSQKDREEHEWDSQLPGGANGRNTNKPMDALAMERGRMALARQAMEMGWPWIFARSVWGYESARVGCCLDFYNNYRFGFNIESLSVARHIGFRHALDGRAGRYTLVSL